MFPFKIYAGVLKLYHYIEYQIGIKVLLEEVDKKIKSDIEMLSY